ncbi:MAG: tetratricopeptide repeat protein [Verrucomicrobiota bacterium]
MSPNSRTTLSLWIGLCLFLGGCADPEAQFLRSVENAQTLIDQGSYEEAIEILNQLNLDFPDRGVVLFEIGRAYEGAENGFFAALFYEQAGQTDPQFAEALYPAAVFFVAEGEAERALRVLNEYLELYPDDEDAWRLSADLLAQANRFQSALSAHLRAEGLDGPSRNPEFAASVGELYWEAGNAAQAEIYFETALEESPEDRFRALMGLLLVTYSSEDYESAEEILNTLDEEFPGAVEASRVAAAREQILLWRATQDALAEQIAMLENRADPILDEANDSTDLGEAGDLSDEAGEATQGRESGEDMSVSEKDGEELVGNQLLGKLLAIDPVETFLPEVDPLPPPPPPPPTTAEKAFEARQAGVLEEAIQLFWMAVQEDSEDAELWAELSATYLMANQPENAEITILEARRRDPDSLQFILSYLDVIQKSRSRARFVEELENAYQQIPNSPDIVLSLARVYAQPGGNQMNAAYFYNEFIEMAPDHPEVPAARRELNALP